MARRTAIEKMFYELRSADSLPTTHGCYRVLQSGKLSARPSVPCATLEEAEKVTARMIKMNPGMSFVAK